MSESRDARISQALSALPSPKESRDFFERLRARAEGDRAPVTRWRRIGIAASAAAVLASVAAAALLALGSPLAPVARSADSGSDFRLAGPDLLPRGGGAVPAGVPILKAWVEFFDVGVSVQTFRGPRVTRLRAGIYRMLVSDRPDSFEKLNFHLVGPGIDRATSDSFGGTAYWIVHLRRGVYTYRADHWPQIAEQSFVVY